MEKLYELFAKVVSATALIIVMITLGSLVSAFPVKWAWNASMPGIFHLKEIGYWEAFSLIWLAGALVKAAPKTKD
jgi:hypothetical protein